MGKGAEEPARGAASSKNAAPRSAAPKGAGPAFAEGPLPKAIAKAAFASGDYPFDEPMSGKAYEKQLLALQIELVKLQAHAREAGTRLAVVFEGRDTAGKGGAITRVTQHLNPRAARVVALAKPTEEERGQWYFQRYAARMPGAGEIALFDRSWYNRGGVEPVMGYCTPEQRDRLLAEAPGFEAMLARDGVRIVKLFLSIGREMQAKRLHARWNDPLKRWKVSPLDFEAQARWEDYSVAYDLMLMRTDHAAAPWTIVLANDKRRARLACLRAVLAAVPYEGRDEDAIGADEPGVSLDAATYLSRGGER